ncbi:hypothetical protein JCM10908_004370 [Rhodotorula pacifica]|uniref:Rco1p n=1 Tax=Rhodotorula pacifica TaxID=1495444 RepID=UPI00316D22EB
MPPESSVPATSTEGNAVAGGSEQPTPDPQQQQQPQPSQPAAPPQADTAETSTDGGGTSNDLDPLAQQEFEAFGVDAEEETLPRPPRDPNAAAALAGFGGSTVGGTASPAAGATSAGPTAVGPALGAKRSLAASTEPLARAKRPKSVKISPAKMSKQFARRAAAPGAVPGEFQLPNHDYCDSCGGKGQFLCCEGGCLRSFHFTCLEPPLDLEEVPEDESWFCKTCRAAAHPPARPRAGFFSELIYKVETENPKQFTLPNELKNYFRNVAVGTNGEFIDSFEHRPPSKITGRAIGQEDRDGYRLKDKNGRPIICYNCDEAASAMKHRRIVSCDFCDQHWHLDCLDPPMSGMPPPTRKWMCPLHADHLVPRKRQTKSTTTQTIERPYRPNNGDIIILPHQEAAAGGEVEEMTVNRVRYQLPEQTVVLDFWNRVTGQKVSGSSSKKSAKARVPRKRSAGYDSGDLSSLSELTSSDESESEATRSSSRRAASSSGLVSALDSLALLAEVRYVDLLNSQQGSSVNGTPGRDAKGKGPRDLPPALPNSIQRRGPRPSAPVPAPGAKRPSIGGTSTAGAVAPTAGTPGATPRSRGGSPSLSPAPRSSELVVETKEDLQALMRIRKLTKAKDAEGDQWRSTLIGFLEGEPILPKLGFIKGDSTPWQRPWEQRRAGGGGADRDKSSSVGAGANGSPALDSPATSPALGSNLPNDPLASAPARDSAEPQAEQGAAAAAANGASAGSQASSAEPVSKPAAASASIDLPFALPAPSDTSASRAVKTEEDAMEVEPVAQAETASTAAVADNTAPSAQP